MKKLLISTLLFPLLLCTANDSLEFEFVKTTETPGFFAVTVFPTQETLPTHKNITFVKNFSKEDKKTYEPVIQFLSEIGAKVIDTLDTNDNTANIVTLGAPVQESKNFQVENEENSLEQFEQFSLQNLKPVFFRNLRAEFGGNISEVVQSQKNIIGDQDMTFIGKFEKDMRTRMLIVTDDKYESIEFQAPLDFTDAQFSQSPLAKKLPTMWEQLQKKESPASPSYAFSLLLWIGGGIILLILVIIFIRYTRRKYRNFLERQEDIHEELPWRTVSSKEDNSYSNPFDIE